MSLVVFEKENGILKIALNRESVLNAINSAVLEELQAGLIQAAASLDINALMLFGQGQCFSAAGEYPKSSGGNLTHRYSSLK